MNAIYKILGLRAHAYLRIGTIMRQQQCGASLLKRCALNRLDTLFLETELTAELTSGLIPLPPPPQVARVYRRWIACAKSLRRDVVHKILKGGRNRNPLDLWKRLMDARIGGGRVGGGAIENVVDVIFSHFALLRVVCGDGVGVGGVVLGVESSDELVWKIGVAVDDVCSLDE
ncbi:hypothetical protein Tco_0954409 [Tanacetum coccineum]|uniref:Uncharacterized protein n=1 Tax=Tanacetum coccineum TaxID=301880 RepID=A0ABQ5E3A9_9ASTR